MAKKQALFRFDEDFHQEITELSEREGLTMSELVRNAIKTYLFLYLRTKNTGARLFIISDKGEKSELVLPWVI